MALFNFFAKKDPSDAVVKASYISASAAGKLLTASLDKRASEKLVLSDLGKVTDFVTLQLVCQDEAIGPDDTAFGNKVIHFKTDYPQQFLFISTKILADPILSQFLVFNGIKCDRPDVIERVDFIDSANNQIPHHTPSHGRPVDHVIEIPRLVRIVISFKIRRKSEPFDFSLRIKDKTRATTDDFHCDPQVGNDPPVRPGP